MDWMQVFTIVGSTVGCCFYFRKESQADLKEVKDEIRNMEARSDGNIKAMETRADLHMNEFRAVMTSFHKETKDFHGRMCTLEEKYQNIISAKGAKSAKAEK